jgi:general secretion pathway protein A
VYRSFFGLSEKPFSITPDPRYLFLSGRHAEALAHLVYGIDEAGGFIQLTGEVGTGKTTIIRSLLAKAPRNAEIALILNPRMTAPEFLLTICEEIGIGVPDSAEGSVKDLGDILSRYLLRAHAEGRRVVLVVDEAQNLAPEVLEQVRLLTNLETETQKLLQIILIGQPELRELLARNDLRQLAQRVTGRYHLDPLSRAEAFAYTKHRLRVAGATSEIFTPAALRELYRVSGGVPRVINVVGDRALLGGYTEERHQISPAMVRRAASEVFGRRLLPAWLPWSLAAACLVLTAGVGATLWHALAQPRAAAPVAQQAPLVAPVKPAVTAVAPQETALPLAALLRKYASETDTDSAFGKLLSLWGAKYQSGTVDGCSQAIQQGLECFQQRGSLAQLRMFNRPAILMLTDEGAAPREVVLATLSDEHAQIDFGGALHRVGLGDLSRYWFGDFILLWKPVDPDTRTLAPGMHGPSVMELRRRLERWSGVEHDTASNELYDARLANLVEQFQQKNRLNVDGVAGVQTQVLLDAALADPGTPLLSPPAAQTLTQAGQ